MNLRFTAKQIEITPDIRAYGEKRLKTISKLLRPPVEVDIILTTEKYRHKVEINAKTKGNVLVVSEESPDLMTALGLAFDSLEKRAKREKEKLREKKRRITRERRAELLAAAEKSSELAEEKRAIRMNDYSLKPMTLEEAILQLELNRKEVFVFRREDNERLAVVFRRRDGNYGLIEPE